MIFLPKPKRSYYQNASREIWLPKKNDPLLYLVLQSFPKHSVKYKQSEVKRYNMQQPTWDDSGFIVS